MQLIPPKAPRLPMSTPEYERGFFDQFAGSLRRYFNELDAALQQLLLGFNTYGTFYSTTMQTNPVPGTPNPVTFAVAALDTFGVAMDSGSRITAARSGVYKLEFTVQLDAVDAKFWARKSGVNIDFSTAPAAPGTVSRSFVVTLVQGEYFELVWASADVAAKLAPSSAAPPVPATPSALVTVTYLCPGSVGAT